MEGYIYILRNDATNLLKIGKTTREPTVRAQEISATTGVPFPFVVAYSVFVNDCDLLERLIHFHLDQYRTNKKREFFDITLDLAIKEIETFIKPQSSAPTESNKDDRRLIIKPQVPLINTLKVHDNTDFDALKYARERMVQNSKESVDKFKTKFSKITEVYKIIRALEGASMIGGKQYPPISISFSRSTIDFYISYLNYDDIGCKAFYNTGWRSISYMTATDSAKVIIDSASMAFLAKEIENDTRCYDYNSNHQYTTKDYLNSLPNISGYSTTYPLSEIKSDIINVINGFSDVNFVAAKHLGLDHLYINQKEDPFNDTSHIIKKSGGILTYFKKILPKLN